MKIIDVVLSKGLTGYYLDDKHAIQKGAKLDGNFYFGNPVTEGFKTVRQPGESVSIILVLEDGQIAYGDCVTGQYSGIGGRDRPFFADDIFPVEDGTQDSCVGAWSTDAFFFKLPDECRLRITRRGLGKMLFWNQFL